jgi:aminotransferase
VTAAGAFPTFEAARQLEAARSAGVEPVPLHGTLSPALPPHVVDAVSRVLGRPMTACPPHGLLELRVAMAAELGEQRGRAVDPETEILVTNGAMHALGVCFRSLVQPGGEVVVPAPCFFFGGPIRAAGASPVCVHSSAADGWRWDADAVERAIGPRTSAVLLCNPGNPTGTVPAKDEVAAVVAVAEAHGLVVVTDEAYEAALWGDAELTSAASFAPDVVVIRSLGKSLAMPQLRVGIVSGPSSRLAPCSRTLEWDCLRVGLAAQEAARAALAGPRDWLASIHAGLVDDRAVALEAVEATPGLSAVPPAAAPFLFVYSETREEIATGLLATGLPVVDGAHFHAPGCARLPFGGAAAAKEALSRALARFAEAREPEPRPR